MPVELKAFDKLLLPPGAGVQEVLCSQGEASTGGLFGVFKLQDGSFAAAWKNHSQRCDTLDELKGYLNQHEQTLLRYGIKE